MEPPVQDLWINKYWKNDGYYDEEDCYYDDELRFIHIGLFGFCGCGEPIKMMKYIKDVLFAINTKTNSVHELLESHSVREVYTDNKLKEIISEFDKVFKSEEIQLIVLYLLDKMELTEHGTSIYGSWLSEFGKNILHDLEIIFKEYDKEEEDND